jgi:hypothetical protein
MSLRRMVSHTHLSGCRLPTCLKWVINFFFHRTRQELTKHSVPTNTRGHDRAPVIIFFRWCSSSATYFNRVIHDSSSVRLHGNSFSNTIMGIGTTCIVQMERSAMYLLEELGYLVLFKFWTIAFVISVLNIPFNYL